MVLYDDNNNNNWFDGPAEYEYCCPNTDPDFGSYQTLISITCSNCEVN